MADDLLCLYVLDHCGEVECGGNERTTDMRNIETKVVCQGHDPDIWHDENRQQEAINLCLKGNGGKPCPALAACLEISTDPSNDTFTRYGVWGGVGQHVRDRIRARRARGEAPRYPIVTFTATDRRTSVPESSL